MGMALLGFLHEGDGGGDVHLFAKGNALEEGLIDHAAEGEIFEVGVVEGEAFGGPIDGVGLGGAPVEGAKLIFDLADAFGVEGGGAGFDFGGPLLAIGGGEGVGIGAELVEKEPGEFLMKSGGAGIGAHAVVAKEANAVMDPAPFFGGRGHEGGEVVGHVPGVIGPDGGATGLELDNPVGELNEFEVASFVLEGSGAHPEDIGQNAAESAEGDGGEGDGGGHVLGGRGLGEMEVAAQVQEVEVEEGGGGEEEEK